MGDLSLAFLYARNSPSSSTQSYRPMIEALRPRIEQENAPEDLPSRR